MRIIIITLFIALYSVVAQAWTNDQIANAIYLAEGGAKTAHPYGILTKYKVTTPRQACINTIAHAKRDWNGKGDFISFLGNRYCPVGCDNDNGTNQYWIKNVHYFLTVGR
jgi:hypothetical protein